MSPNSACRAKGLPVLNERASVAITSTFTSLRLSSLATSAGWLLMVASSSAESSARQRVVQSSRIDDGDDQATVAGGLGGCALEVKKT